MFFSGVLPSLPVSIQAQRGNGGRPTPIDALLATATQQLIDRQFEMAYNTAVQALVQSRRRNDTTRTSRSANLVAIASFQLGRTAQAINFFRQALPTPSVPASIASLQILALSRTGGALLVSGRYEDAHLFLQQALQFSRQQQDRSSEVRLLGQLGKVFAETGDLSNATLQLQAALPLAQTQHDTVGEASILRQLLIVEKNRGNLDAALSFGERALALTRQPVQSQAGVELIYQLAGVFTALNRSSEAADLFERGLRIARTMNFVKPEAFLLGDYAGLKLKVGDAGTARDLASQALVLIRRGPGNKHMESLFCATLAEAQRKLGQNEDAVASYREALAALEQARLLSVPTEIARAGIVSGRQQVFDGAIDLLLSLGRTEDAFDVAESYHARAFLDVLAETGLDSPGEMSETQQAEDDRLSEQIAEIQNSLAQAQLSEDDERRLQLRLAETENALSFFRLQQRRADPRYDRVQSPPLLTYDRISSGVLDSRTALIEYVTSSRRSFVWVVAHGTVHAVTLPTDNELSKAIDAFRTAFSSKVSSQESSSSIVKLKAQGEALYRRLFQPLESYLQSVDKLLIVPDGELSYLPFEALSGDLQKKGASAPFLVERFSISYAPSGSALAALRAIRDKHDVRGIVAFGDPDYSGRNSLTLSPLPFTRTEVNGIGALFAASDRRIFLGDDANEYNVKSEDLDRYRYIHFATHAVIDEENPANSGIILSSRSEPRGIGSNDGVLKMGEVMHLKLNADLVTLSACRTGLGQVINGEGIIGLTRAFLYAGASSVAVSLWNVNDTATASLMKSFYRNLSQGLPKDEALRQAKLDLILGQQQAWRHPYYWAAFVLVGHA